MDAERRKDMVSYYSIIEINSIFLFRNDKKNGFNSVISWSTVFWKKIIKEWRSKRWLRIWKKKNMNWSRGCKILPTYRNRPTKILRVLSIITYRLSNLKPNSDSPRNRKRRVTEVPGWVDPGALPSEMRTLCDILKFNQYLLVDWYMIVAI